MLWGYTLFSAVDNPGTTEYSTYYFLEATPQVLEFSIFSVGDTRSTSGYSTLHVSAAHELVSGKHSTSLRQGSREGGDTKSKTVEADYDSTTRRPHYEAGTFSHEFCRAHEHRRSMGRREEGKKKRNMERKNTAQEKTSRGNKQSEIKAYNIRMNCEKAKHQQVTEPGDGDRWTSKPRREGNS